MRTSFTPQEICEMTAKDLAALRIDSVSHPDTAWVDQVAGIIEDLHGLASQNDRNPMAIADLEQRVAAFLAADRRNKGLTPYLYMVRSVKPSGPPTI